MFKLVYLSELYGAQILLKKFFINAWKLNHVGEVSVDRDDSTSICNSESTCFCKVGHFHDVLLWNWLFLRDPRTHTYPVRLHEKRTNYETEFILQTSDFIRN